jgi:hypothetical protein
MPSVIPGTMDNNATGAFYMMINACKMCQYIVVDLDELQHMYIMWRQGKTVLEYTTEQNIPEDDSKPEKIRKINQSKKAALENLFTDTTIFGMRKDENSPIVITDGIHRAIGIQKAINEDSTVKRKICLRLLLCDGEKIAELDDYRLSIASST